MMALSELDGGEREIEQKLRPTMKKNLKYMDMPTGAMTDFQREIIFARVLERKPKVTFEGIWRDWAQCFIWEKWQKVEITFNPDDDTYFEDFCNEIIHRRKKLQYKEIDRRKKVIEAEEENQQKETVISKGPIRRFRSEIPIVDHMRKRAHSTVMKTPAFTNIMKS